ncbi:SDR family oxidoreductase [Desulfobacterales bacterium RS19-109]|uniref:SDR family oxidoreductase n=1 Tax=Thiovibrio frasassiensis TaxID=2984131 RepID=A0A9X4MEF4_9BACT|nr:SDR family oxidoreductase [Thiovibrio frasassiensis]MDG4476054.1 SDR family oxidoreductase [Thiovibrio frasassiensis]
MSRALVTGANGFVGQPLCEEMLLRGWQVLAAVRSSRRLPQDMELVTVGAIDGETNWAEALRGVGAVVHLAARVHIMRDKATDPLTEFRAVNVAAALNLARQAAKAGVQRFVYLSSIKVNGEQTLSGQPFTEEDVSVPLGPYSISKCEAEEGLRTLAQRTGMEVVVIRPPLIYGPGVKANFLNMLRWLHAGVPLPLGSINNRRSIVALDNLIDLIIRCLDHPAAADQTFLVSDGEDLSTTALLRRMAHALGRPARLMPLPVFLLEAGAVLLGRRDMAQRLCGSLQVDISRARTLLGWNPPISVDEGLRRTAQWFLHETTV